MKSSIIRVLKKLVGATPDGAVKFIYLKIFSPKPLRTILNGMIKIIIPEYLTIDEGKVFLDQDDAEVSGALLLGAHDPFEIQTFRAAIRPGMPVIDIGANIGYYTVIAAGRTGQKGHVIAYEPVGPNFALLEKSLRQNNFSWVTPIKEAISDKVGKQAIFLADYHSGVHSFIDNRGFGRSTEVTTDTLDGSLEKRGITRVDIIKMDIEGFEIMALAGMKLTLAANRNLTMFLELYPQAIERLGKAPLEYLEALNDLGFKLSLIDEDRRQLVPLVPHEFKKFLSGIPKKGEVAKNIMASR